MTEFFPYIPLREVDIVDLTPRVRNAHLAWKKRFGDKPNWIEVATASCQAYCEATGTPFDLWSLLNFAKLPREFERNQP